jgi:hypothetical protein
MTQFFNIRAAQDVSGHQQMCLQIWQLVKQEELLI